MNDHVTFEPATVAAAAGTGAAERTRVAARVGLLGIGAAAVLSAAIIAFASVASPGGTLAAGRTDNASTTTEILELGGGRGGHGGAFGHMFGGITITAISGTSISLETEDGWTRTITVDDETTFTRDDDAIGLADLRVGDRIGFRQTLEDDGTWTIDAVAVILPHVGGEVTAVDGSTITVEGRDGTTATITVNAGTEYRVNGEDATLADVEVGMLLVAAGEEGADGSLTASTVRATEPGELRGPGRGFIFAPGGPLEPKHVHPDASATPDEDAGAS